MISPRASSAAKGWGKGARDDGVYGRGFADPDGHAWQVMFLEPRHVID